MSEKISENYDLAPSENPNFIIDYAGILKILPHRYPFLFIDGVISFEKGKSIVGQKNFSFNESFFAGHFPGEPVAPGVIQIEALAQISCILVALSFDDLQDKRPAFTGIEKAKFRKPVRPGHVMILKAELENFRKGFALLNCSAEVNGELAVQATIKAAMV